MITLGTYLTWGMWDSSRTKDNFLLLFLWAKRLLGVSAYEEMEKILWEGFSYLDSCELIQNSYVSTIYPFKSTGCNWGFAVSVVRFPSFCTLVEEKWKEGYGWVVIFSSLRIKQVLHNALSIYSQVPLPSNSHNVSCQLLYSDKVLQCWGSVLLLSVLCLHSVWQTSGGLVCSYRWHVCRADRESREPPEVSDKAVWLLPLQMVRALVCVYGACLLWLESCTLCLS